MSIIPCLIARVLEVGAESINWKLDRLGEVLVSKHCYSWRSVCILSRLLGRSGVKSQVACPPPPTAKSGIAACWTALWLASLPSLLASCLFLSVAKLYHLSALIRPTCMISRLATDSIDEVTDVQHAKFALQSWVSYARCLHDHKYDLDYLPLQYSSSNDYVSKSCLSVHQNYLSCHTYWQSKAHPSLHRKSISLPTINHNLKIYNKSDMYTTSGKTTHLDASQMKPAFHARRRHHAK